MDDSGYFSIIIKIMLTVVIQAGGESRRMGQDKGLVLFLGRPLVYRAIQNLQPISDEMIVTTNHPESYSFLGLPLFPDLIPGRGALGGLLTALSAASEPLVAVVACDMPFVSAELLAAERDMLVKTGADAVIPLLEGGMEPFHSVYRRETCLPLVQAAVEADCWRADAWFRQARIVLMGEAEIRTYDPQLRSFSNINTPEELRQAENLARAG